MSGRECAPPLLPPPAAAAADEADARRISGALSPFGAQNRPKSSFSFDDAFYKGLRGVLCHAHTRVEKRKTPGRSINNQNI